MGHIWQLVNILHCKFLPFTFFDSCWFPGVYGSSSWCLSSLYSSAEITTIHYCVWLYFGSGGPSTVLHTLPTKSSPSSSLYFSVKHRKHLYIQNKYIRPDMVMYILILQFRSPGDRGRWILLVWGQPGLHVELQSSQGYIVRSCYIQPTKQTHWTRKTHRTRHFLKA